MGKLIVIEGLDGSGKSTQIKLLSEKLKLKNIDYRQIKLPDYDSECCAPVKKYLSGDFGKNPDDVNAYAASTFYAVDRFVNYKLKWKSDYDNGVLIIADRYTTSNAYHQATKLPEEQWVDYFNWLEDFEYNKIKIPKPDVVIYLDMPIDVSQKMMTSRYNGDENKKDIHESNISYLNSCRIAAKEAAKSMGWHIITCNEGDIPRKREDINEDIMKIIYKYVF